MTRAAIEFLIAPPAEVHGSLRSVDFPSGTVIIEQGALPEYVYFLKAGEARVYTLTLNGSSYLEHIYAAGEVFGEFEALNRRPYLSSVLASSRCEVVRVANEDFLRWIQLDAAFGLFISQQLADKMYAACLDAVVNIAYPLRYRVLYFLWNVAQNGGSSIRKADVIAGLGSNERSVNRIVKDLVNALLIDYQDGIISIPDLDDLVREMKRFE